MPRVSYYVAASANGHIATPTGGTEWLAPFETAGEDYGYAAFYGDVDAILLGRRAYEKCLGFDAWPFPGRPCWVFTQSRIGRAPAKVTATADDPATVLAGLRARGLRHAWLMGGGALAGAFRRAGLIADYIISVVPVLFGAGIPLFTNGGAAQPLALSESRNYPNGVLQRHFRNAAATDA